MRGPITVIYPSVNWSGLTTYVTPEACFFLFLVLVFRFCFCFHLCSAISEYWLQFGNCWLEAFGPIKTQQRFSATDFFFIICTYCCRYRMGGFFCSALICQLLIFCFSMCGISMLVCAIRNFVRPLSVCAFISNYFTCGNILCQSLIESCNGWIIVSKFALYLKYPKFLLFQSDGLLRVNGFRSTQITCIY